MNKTTTSYQDFLAKKRHSIGNQGFDANYYPDIAFDFQKSIIDKAVKKGRCAIFADTGLGKTLIQLAIAENIIRHTNKKVLILTPLAVAFQFIEEAQKIGIADIEYSKNGKHSKKIVICNYERLHHFEPDDFICVICDESSILKNFDGKIKNQITNFIRKVEYRFLCTATPSPNDYIELGTSSEALGHMGYVDMLSKFFKNNQGSIDIRNSGEKWYLKPHAEKDFWAWVNQWSISIRKPSDLGFSDENYILPPLNERQHIVINDKPLEVNGQMQMFAQESKSFRDIRSEAKATIDSRCQKAVELAQSHDNSVYWVNLNDESSRIAALDPSAVEIIGSMSIDKKESILVAFSKGEVKKLITKTSITAFGLNWQHCNHTTYFPTYSFEQYYQAIRRFWRFGQKRDVFVDLVLSDGQTKIMKAIEAKKEKAIAMFENLIKNTHQDFSMITRAFDKPVKKPSFL